MNAPINGGWTSVRLEGLRDRWGKGETSEEIAKELGGFEGCPDKGKSAVLGKVCRLRTHAKEAGDSAETAFWSREKKSRPKFLSKKAKCESKGASVAKSFKHAKTFARAELDELIAAPQAAIPWPTKDEVAASWKASLFAAAASDRY